MSKLIKKLLEKRELSVKEKISQAKKKHSGMDLVTEIIRIEGLEDVGKDPEHKEWEKWYIRFTNLCWKHEVEFEIP